MIRRPPTSTLFPYPPLFRSADGDLPYRTATELIYRSVYPRDTLERALATFDYKNRRREQVAARSAGRIVGIGVRSEEHTSELQSRLHLVCRLLLEKKKQKNL